MRSKFSTRRRETHAYGVRVGRYITLSRLIVVGAVAGGLKANPAILGSISGAGLVLKTFSETKDYKKKIELSKFCYTTYSKVLVELRTSLRGDTFDKDDFLKEMTILDEIIVDFTPLVTRFEKQYAKMFLSHPRENVKQNGGEFETTTSSPGPLAQRVKSISG